MMEGFLAGIVMVVLCLCALFASVHSSNTTVALGQDPRIFKGKTNPTGYPWLMFLAYYKGEGRATQFCGATLIDKSWVMTAAHCVVNEDIRHFIVAYGQTNFVNETFDGAYVTRKIIHPAYKKDGNLHMGSDVALLKLAKQIKLRPIKLNRGDKLESPGAKLKISGWGLVLRPLAGESGIPENAQDLQEAEVTPLEEKECIKRLSSTLPGYMCAGTKSGDRDTCAGDSGGPLHKANSTHACQVGIVSYGPKYSCNPKFGYKRASAFQRVSEVISWIRKYVKNVGTCVQ